MRGRSFAVVLLAAAVVLPQLEMSAVADPGDVPESAILSPIDEATVASDRMPVRVRADSQATQALVRPVGELASLVKVVDLTPTAGELRGLVTGLQAGKRYELDVVVDGDVVDTSTFAVVDLTVHPTRVDVRRSEPVPLAGDQPVTLSGLVWPGHVDKGGDAGHPGLGYVARLVDVQDVTFGLGVRTNEGTVSRIDELQLTLPADDQPGGLMPVYTQLNLLEPRAPRIRTPAVEFEIELPAENIAEYVDMTGVTAALLDELVIWVEPSDVLAEGLVPICTDVVCASIQSGGVTLPVQPYASADPTPVYISDTRARNLMQNVGEAVAVTTADDPSYDSLRKAFDEGQDEALRTASLGRLNGTNYLVSLLEVVDDASEVVRQEWDRASALINYPGGLVDANPAERPAPLGSYAVRYPDGLPYPVTPDLVGQACKQWNFCSPAEADAAEAFWNTANPMEHQCVDKENSAANDNCFQTVYGLVDHSGYNDDTGEVTPIPRGDLNVYAYMFNEYGLWGGDYEEFGYAFNHETDGFWEKTYWGGGWSYVKRWRELNNDEICQKEYNYEAFPTGDVSNYPSGTGYSPGWGEPDNHTRQVGNFAWAGEQFKKGTLTQSWYANSSDEGFYCEGWGRTARIALQWAYTRGSHEFSDAYWCVDCPNKRDGLIGMRFVHRKRKANWSMTCGAGYPVTVGCDFDRNVTHEEAWHLRPRLPFLYYDVDDF